MKLKLFIIFFALTLIFAPTVKAADSEITCDTNGCSDIGAIFNESNMYPGQNLTKTLKVTNNYNEARSFALEIQGSNYSDSTPSMGDAIKITIVDQSGGGGTIYGPKSINQWKNDGFTSIGMVDSKSSKTYELKIGFDNVGNDYKNQKLSFDLKLGFETNDQSSTNNTSSTSTPTPRILGVLTSILDSKITTEIPAPLVPQTLGVQCIKDNVPWWIFLVLEFTTSLLILRRAKIKRWKGKKIILSLITIAILSQIAHEIIGCDCQSSVWCQRYLFINAAIFLLSLGYYSRKRFVGHPFS